MGRYRDENSEAKNLISAIETLPEDILLKISTLLPAADGIRAGCVSKNWQKVTHMISSSKCVDNEGLVPTHNPWFFMLTVHEWRGVIGCSYDCDAQSWCDFNFPYLAHSHPDDCIFTPSHGLICISDCRTLSDYKFTICNPLLKRWRMLPWVPTSAHEQCVAVAFSVDIQSKTYYTIVVKARDDCNESSRREVGIELYDSKKKCWTNLYYGSLGDASVCSRAVICSGILYCQIMLPNPVDMSNIEPRTTAVMAYDLSSTRFEDSLVDSAILVPRDLVLEDIMNLNDKLILVGRIKKQYAWEISIWELCEKKWNEISKMPRELMIVLFRNDGRFPSETEEMMLHYEFGCSGFNDLVYIYSSSPRKLAIFSLSERSWRLIDEAPIPNEEEDPSWLYGFCCEPRLDILP